MHADSSVITKGLFVLLVNFAARTSSNARTTSTITASYTLCLTAAKVGLISFQQLYQLLRLRNVAARDMALPR